MHWYMRQRAEADLHSNDGDLEDDRQVVQGMDIKAGSQGSSQHAQAPAGLP